MPVSLEEMLEARERRASRQRDLSGRYGLPLVSFTMNIAGPVKDSPLIRRGAAVGDSLLRAQLKRVGAELVSYEKIDAPTGPEALYVVDMDPQDLKRLTVGLEDHTDLGRLFDMDVIAPSGEKLDRAVPRRCLICGGPAWDCARSRVHTVEELQARSRRILSDALDRIDAETVGSLACRALLYEVCVTPKPGLVDRANNGSHRDMDLYTFLRSSAALWPWFAECARTGRRLADRPPRETFDALRWPGRLAEGTMLLATGGVNTHRGAVFSLGLLCASLGRLDRDLWSDPGRVCAGAAAMVEGVTAQGLTGPSEGTRGAWIRRRWGLTGPRGEAEAGFPTVLGTGLPVLEEGLSRGLSPDRAGAAAMLSMLARGGDTNLAARGGPDRARETAERIGALLAEDPWPDEEVLSRLDRELIEEGLSPGGSADLLALCWFLHSLREEDP